MFFTRSANSFLPVISLLLRMGFLMTKGRAVTASPIPDPLPTDDEIRQAFIGVRPDETFLTSEILATRALYDQFAARYAPKKSLIDVFPEYFLIYKGGQSGLCYNDFVDRCCRIFAEQSSGDVFLLSKWPEGPTEPDSLFNAVEFPAFAQNPNVRRIYLVNPDDLSQRIQYWPRNPDDPDRVETVSEDESLDRLMNTPTIGAGAAAGGLGLLQTHIGALLNPFYVPSNEKLTPQKNEDHDTGESRLDSFFVDTASLPKDSEGIMSTQSLFTDESLPMAGDESSLFATIPSVGTEAFTGDGDDDEDITTYATIDGTDPDFLFSSSLDDSTNLFEFPAKRQLTLHSRACTLRPSLEKDLFFLFDGTNTAYAAEEDDPTNSVPFPGARPAYATIHVVQRRFSSYAGLYKLDVEIRNSGGQLIGSAMDADAFPNQRVEIQSNLPYRVQVWTQEGDEHLPLKFQYGPTGPYWDSNDSSPETHDCKADEWREDHREMECKFGF